jgi:hypothetical protein
VSEKTPRDLVKWPLDDERDAQAHRSKTRRWREARSTGAKSRTLLWGTRSLRCSLTRRESSKKLGETDTSRPIFSVIGPRPKQTFHVPESIFCNHPSGETRHRFYTSQTKYTRSVIGIFSTPMCSGTSKAVDSSTTMTLRKDLPFFNVSDISGTEQPAG